MNRSLARAAALAAAVAITLAGSVTLATSASAEPSEGVNADSASTALVVVAATPVVPQPVVAGHEGDVLLQVNVAMPASVKATKAVKSKSAAAHALRARR